jgi:hypothetical protein
MKDMEGKRKTEERHAKDFERQKEKHRKTMKDNERQVTRHIVENQDVTWLDWNRLNPARNLSIFKIEPDLLTQMGIDDEEMPVTDDDRAINIIRMGDDDSVAGRMSHI